jgi:hypothetical protein
MLVNGWERAAAPGKWLDARRCMTLRYFYYTGLVTCAFLKFVIDRLAGGPNIFHISAKPLTRCRACHAGMRLVKRSGETAQTTLPHLQPPGSSPGPPCGSAPTLACVSDFAGRI